MAKRIESRFIPANFLCVDRLSRMHHCNEQKSTPRENAKAPLLKPDLRIRITTFVAEYVKNKESSSFCWKADCPFGRPHDNGAVRVYLVEGRCVLSESGM